MSVRVWSLCWRVPVGGNTKLVLLRLADFANDTGGSIFPTIATVAEDCGISERTVQYCLRELEEGKYIIPSRGPKTGRGYVTSYRIDMNRINETVRPAREWEQSENIEENKGANSAPFPAPMGAKNDEMGANFAEKGASVAPNPSLTVKNPPIPTAREGAPVMPVGGGGSDIQQVIEEFYRIAGRIWGVESVQRERLVTMKNDARAGEWIAAAGGSVELVLQLLGPALNSYSQGRGCPGTLGAINQSMPRMISDALTAAPSRTTSKPFAGPSSTAGDDTWVGIKSLAFRNGHFDVADEIRRRAVEISDDEANRFAEDMRSYVSTKKAMAAA